MDFKVFFNAFRTKHGRHLLAIGWTSSTQLKPRLKRNGEAEDFIFKVEKIGEAGAQVITPFHLCAVISNDPRSINVLVEEKGQQVQVSDVSGCESGDNKPGVWVEC